MRKLRLEGRRRPAIEGLEVRRLPTAAALPNLAMVAASTADSKGVTVSYQVDGAPINRPVELAVYRSADATYDAGDVLVGSTELVPSGQPGATLDQAGRPATATGAHQVTFALPGGLPPDPQKPYVVAVADPSGAVPESSKADNSASFRTYVIGVVTHGGIQDKRWVNGPRWAGLMAGALRAEGYDAVIPFNWVFASNTPGAAARQGVRLAAMIDRTAAAFPATAPVDLHLIGHSEGAVVNSQAVLRLNRDGWPSNLASGYLTMTMLDPHAASNATPGRQYSVSHGLLGWVARNMIDDYQSRASDPPVIVPPNVDDAEVFYQHTPASQTHGSNEGIYNLWGQVPVRGQADYFDLTAAGISHSGKFGVPEWYQLNIVPTLGDGAPFLRAIALTGAQDAGTVGTGAPSYSGQAAPGSSVTVLATPAGTQHLSPIGRATAGPDGSWHLDARPLAGRRFQVMAVASLPDVAMLPRPMHLRPTAYLGALTVSPGSPIG